MNKCNTEFDSMPENGIGDGFTEYLDENSNMGEDDSFTKTSPERNVLNQDSSDDCDDEVPTIKAKKRVQRFANSDSDSGKENTQNGDITVFSDKEVILPSKRTLQNDSDSSSDSSNFKNHPQKSRLRNLLKDESDDSDSDSAPSRTKVPLKNEEQQARMTNKRVKMREKFKSLITSRANDDNKLSKDVGINNYCKSQEATDNESSVSENSDMEGSSILKLKQKIKERTMGELKMSICDPDTSDEESGGPKEIMQKPKKGRKSTKLISPKPMRMTAKQAMENMKKIKSESNRMLREKEISLPYHRPKALSLKDIMSRRRPAVSADGKALPIKMNEEQLRQYALSLEQRQKEMMELCKSESDEEYLFENKKEPNEAPTDNETIQTSTQNKDDISFQNDILYDNLCKINTGTEVNDCTDNDDHKQNSTNIDLTDLNLKKISNIFEEKKREEKETDVSNTVTEEIDSQLETITETNSKLSNDLPQKNNLESNTSAEMSLVYNDSVEENQTDDNIENDVYDANDDSEENPIKSQDKINKEITVKNAESNNPDDSQLISLHYNDTEKEINTEDLSDRSGWTERTDKFLTSKIKDIEEGVDEHEFSDNDDVNMEDIDKLIENAEIIKSQSNIDYANSPLLIKDNDSLKIKPKLMGRPGMVIDLDGTDPCVPKKLTGVELLKERFKYFARLKTPEELEREREKRIKPGTQHIKLKQELEEKIAEQRSLEWAKRLDEEKQQQMELDAVIGDDDLDDIDKIEAKLEEKELTEDESYDEEELEEELESQEKPRKRNPMIADEAEESDCDDLGSPGDENSDGDADADVDDDEEDSDETSEESEDEQQLKPKKGRILKAFEDSDDEDSIKVAKVSSIDSKMKENEVSNKVNEVTTSEIKETQDEELQLAQMHKSYSEDLFTSQENEPIASNQKMNIPLEGSSSDDKDFGTQTFSILDSSVAVTDLNIPVPDKLTVTCDTQPYEGNLDAVVGMCSGSFSQNLVTSQYPTQSQPQIGEDVLALCTGQFYDNQFISQLDANSQKENGGFLPQNDKREPNVAKELMNSMEMEEISKENDASKEAEINVDLGNNYENPENINVKDVTDHMTDKNTTNITKDLNSHVQNGDNRLHAEENKLLTSILDELNDPEFESPKPNKYFASNDAQGKENTQNVANVQLKKRFIIDSDNEENDKENVKKRKKLKKKKLEQRALQISDDEEEEDPQDQEEGMSELEDDTKRIVEYDSEENEVEVLPQQPKKKRKATDFFEQEAELTSEDEWAGSGDEDERGLDRMEREEGDDDTFNQTTLQRELGQIHMRDVLDQDKREVRLIQELLFEDGDLGAGGRQRKFKWRNADGEEETGTIYDELADTQEVEFESEEQWRKQRHEREMYLKQMQQEEVEDNLNVTVNRTTIIKANLKSKTMSSLLLEVNNSKPECESPVADPAPEKKSSKDIPSPKKPFAIFQQSYHGSLLTRGRGALARLAALATPLAVEDDVPKAGSLVPSSKRNFVFASVTPDEKEPKITKRKAEINADTPRLAKKMKTEDKQARPRNSLLDHIQI